MFSLWNLTSLIFIMASFTLLSLNVRGCQDSLKRFNLFSHLHNIQKADIYCLQDTHSSADEEDTWRLIWRNNIVFSHSPHKRAGGVCIMLSPKSNIQIISQEEIVPGRLLHLIIKIGDTQYNLVNIYAPSDGNERDVLFQRLKNKISTFSTDPIIIAGDYNCTLLPKIDRLSTQEPHPRSANSLARLCNKHKLIDAWRNFHGEEHQQFTWRNKNACSRIDRVYISKHIRTNIKYSAIYDVPNSLSDHSAIVLSLYHSKIKNKSPYWCLNTSVLDEDSYCNIIRAFWDQWKLVKSDYSSIQFWWDVGKMKIKHLSQEYCSSRQKLFKDCKQELEYEIRFLEARSKIDPEFKASYRAKKEQLDTLLEQMNKGAAIRSRFQHLNECDSSSKYFYELEKQRGQKKIINHLKKSDGRITEDQVEIREMTQCFYQTLFSPDETNLIDQNSLLSDLPKITDADSKQLDQDLTLEELTTSVKLLRNGKSPGIDGLPAEFYKTFWNLLGPDVLEVFKSSCEDGLLPLSCRRAILTLLPKKGDNGLLKNWRPVSLLCLDYKIFTRTLSIRLKTVLSNIIHLDQTYTVPGRHIFDNIHVCRDIVYSANRNYVPLAIVSLDQEKAFDRINHSYLFKTLKAFGFGDNFVSFIKLIYTQAQLLVKVNGGLTNPITFGRGIRQGCSLSGQLYAICIEPLLQKLRQHMSGYNIPNTEKRICLSAYADDVNLFPSTEQDFDVISHWLGVYQLSSNAKVNMQKTSGLWCGSWKTRTDTPLNITWKSDGLKVLGNFIGNSKEFEKQNWNDMELQIDKSLQKWKPFVRALSYRGRALICNQLAGSKIYYRLVCFAPPKDIVRDLQRKLVDFLWQGRHWIPAEIVYLHISEGGLGLINIESRIGDFRLQFIKKYLGSEVDDHPVFHFCDHFLRSIGSLGYDKQLFDMDLKIPAVTPIPDFYRQLFHTWNRLTHKRLGDHDIGYIIDQPLFQNYEMVHPYTQEQFTLDHFVDAGITKIRDLINFNNKAWFTADELAHQFPSRSVRILNRDISMLRNAMPPAWLGVLNAFLRQNILCTSFDSLYNIVLSVPDFDEISVSVLSAKRKEFYNILVKSISITTTNTRLDSVWRDLLSLQDNVGPDFTNTYLKPNVRRQGDIQWRILHGAICTGSLNMALGRVAEMGCPFCNERDDLLHIFLQCPRLFALIRIVKSTVKFLSEDSILTPENFIFGFKVPKSGPRMRTFSLINYLLTTSKWAIHLSYQHKIENDNFTDALYLFTGKIRRRLKTEFAYYKLTDKLLEFEDIWCIERALCYLQNEDLHIVI